MRYSTDPVLRARKEFSSNGMRYIGNERGIIDATLLTGFWTPKGLIQRARVIAENYSRSES